MDETIHIVFDAFCHHLINEYGMEPKCFLYTITKVQYVDGTYNVRLSNLYCLVLVIRMQWTRQVA